MSRLTVCLRGRRSVRLPLYMKGLDGGHEPYYLGMMSRLSVHVPQSMQSMSNSCLPSTMLSSWTCTAITCPHLGQVSVIASSMYGEGQSGSVGAGGSE